MNSSKNGNRLSDRVDPKMVTPSRHSVFIRGFPSNMSMENVRAFFKNESKENCKIDFFSYSEDRKKLFIALRFESHEKAMDVIENFDNKEVLGHNIEISWFKDLRKARKQLIEEERASRNNESRSPVEWNVMSRAQSGYMWSGRLIRNRGMRNMGNFSRLRDYQRQRMFNTRNTGCWRRARLSPNHSSRIRRDRSHSRSRSYSYSRSKSRSHSRSYSSKRQSYSSYSSRKSKDKSLSNKDIGHDSVHKYRIIRSNSCSSEKNETKSKIPKYDFVNDARVDSTKNEIRPKSCEAIEKNIEPNLLNIVQTYSLSHTESSSSSNEMSKELEKISNKKHKKKSRKRIKKKRINKKSRDSDENSSIESLGNQRSEKIHHDESTIDKYPYPSDRDLVNTFPSVNKDIKDDTEDLINVKFEFPNLTAEDRVKVLSKKESLEKAYKKDCETVALVSKLIISKNPSLEENILIILKSIFSDIGDKYIEELRSYVNYLGESK